MAPSSPGSRPRPPGGLRPALTPTPGDAHRQRRGAGSNKPRSPRFQGIATQTAATRFFTPAALTAPTADLHKRFTTVHKGLRKLSGDYRRDKKSVMALLADGVVLNDAIPRLPLATAWQQAIADYDTTVGEHADR